MNQGQRRKYLLNYLLNENRLYADTEIPETAQMQIQLLRGLMNVRLAGSISREFLEVQDAYLQEAIREKGIVTLDCQWGRFSLTISRFLNDTPVTCCQPEPSPVTHT